jgi:tRNA 2-selenouridine synthase
LFCFVVGCAEFLVRKIMAVQRVAIEEFLELSEDSPILDVRSPAEYAHAHIPGAHSLPLFTDEERKAIGTAYKEQSREIAIKIGLDAFGPKMRGMVEQAELLLKDKKHQEHSPAVLVHCWRGGMRSDAVAWLLDLYGFKVYQLEGGYKAYRHWVIAHWLEGGSFNILDGYTGAGKTLVLYELEKLGAPVLDLEGIAAHKGSAFGGLDKIPQPTQEMFENQLATRIAALRRRHSDKPIWIENESQRIGDVNIPIDLYRYWSSGKLPTVFLDVPFEERLENIAKGYGHYNTESLINAIVRIKTRLGPLETKTAIAHLVEGDIKACFHILLHYYDKHYQTAPVQKSTAASGLSATEIAHQILSTNHE